MRSFREMFETLFPNQLVIQLRRELDYARQEEAAHLKQYERDLDVLTSFHRERIEDLKARERDISKERDYFRGRAERLELRILPDPTPRKERSAGVPFAQGRPSGTWQQIQKDHAEKMRIAAEQEAAAEKRKKEAIDAPQSPEAESAEDETSPPTVEESRGTDRPGAAQPHERRASTVPKSGRTN